MPTTPTEQPLPAFVVYAGGRPSGSSTGAAPLHVLDRRLTSLLRDGSAGR
ncbi:hypothetical protein [Nonomuraea dietziae]